MSLQSPYHCEGIEYGYRFETDFGFVYELSFLRYPTLSECTEYVLYMFNIEQVRKGKISTDARIQITIDYVLSRFFENNTDAVLVVMYSSDGKHLARERLFDKWYYKSIKNGHHRFSKAWLDYLRYPLHTHLVPIRMSFQPLLLPFN